MTAVLMSYDDAYVVACLGAAFGLVVVFVGMCVDRWPEWRANHRDNRARRALYLSYLAEDRSAYYYERGYVRGCVQNPADPSPRVRRLIADGIRVEDERNNARARSVADEQR